MINDRETIFAALVEGCEELKFKEMVCPSCGSPLRIRVHSDQQTFHVRCDKDSTHLSKHEVCVNPHSWFRTMGTGLGWY